MVSSLNKKLIIGLSGVLIFSFLFIFGINSVRAQVADTGCYNSISPSVNHSELCRINSGHNLTIKAELFEDFPCYVINNQTNEDLFIPTKSYYEWTSFLQHHPAGVSLEPCTHTLTGTISGSGTVNVNPPNTDYTSNFSRTYDYGTSVTLSATAGEGYTFTGWSGACSGTGTCTVSMTADRSVTASFNLNIPPVPSGVSCSTASASQINVSWNASSGADDYLVYRCTGDGCTPTSNTYTTSSTSWSNTGLSAGTIYRYRVRARNAVGTSGYSSTVTCITVPATPSGLSCATASPSQINVSWNSVTGASDYLVYRCTGSTCTPSTLVRTQSSTSWGNTGLSANTTYRYRVQARNSGGTSSYSSIATCTTPASNYSLVVNKDGTGSGTVTSDPSGISCGSTCSANFSYGTSVTLSASAASGSVFTGWSGDCSGTGTCTVSMTANRSVTATFTITTHTLTGTISGSGTVNVNPPNTNYTSNFSRTYNYGTSVTLSATAGTGYAFAGWSGACSGTGTCTVSMTANRSVTATFTITRRILVGEIDGLGTVNVNPPNTNYSSNFSIYYDYGTSVTLSATAGEGYTFAGWSGACSGTGTCTVSMTGHQLVTATFN